MKTMLWLVIALALLSGLGARADTTNMVPWFDSFEGYTNGTLIAGTNGWTSLTPTAGVVTNWQYRLATWPCVNTRLLLDMAVPPY